MRVGRGAGGEMYEVRMAYRVRHKDVHVVDVELDAVQPRADVVPEPVDDGLAVARAVGRTQRNLLLRDCTRQGSGTRSADVAVHVFLVTGLNSACWYTS